MEIRSDICAKEWERVCGHWSMLRSDLVSGIPGTEPVYDSIDECDWCVDRKNYLHFHDCLTYKIDLFIMKRLLSLGEEERKKCSDNARRENENALNRYHRDLSWLLSKKFPYRDLECIYEGTENVSISVEEGSNRFRLFSIVNPWLESSSMIKENVRGNFIPGEIHVLGIGGGHLVSGLKRKYPDTRIRVYIPNADVFQAVLLHIPLKEILTNEKIELVYDPLCLDFIKKIEEETAPGRIQGTLFYMDPQEIRASFKSLRMAYRLIWKYKNCLEHDSVRNYVYKNENGNINGVGKNIYDYIKESL